jgi:WD40 repeat protein
MRHLITLFLLCVLCVHGTLAQTTEPRAKRVFVKSKTFVENDDPACYSITLQEADRAFRGRFWDDAGKLYRAAKNCTDTDPGRSRYLNERIEACRLAAENELLEEQEKARREARQAEATNRANDARLLLEGFDRTRAFRLADFANEYIAPNNNNPACLQTIVDAWNYDPTIHSGYVNKDQLVVPLTYEVANNMGENVQIQYMGPPNNQRLYAFVPQRGQLKSWDMTNLKSVESTSIDTIYQKMDVSPDGQTLLFQGKDGFMLWRNSQNTFQWKLPQRIKHCFNDSGSQLYYYNPADKAIYMLLVSEAFNPKPTKVTRTQKSVSALPRIVVQNIDSNLVAIGYGDSRLWLVYSDKMEVVYPGGDNSGFSRPKMLQFEMEMPIKQYDSEHLEVLICPEQRIVYFCKDNVMITGRVDQDFNAIRQLERVTGLTLSATAKGNWYSLLTTDQFGRNPRIGIWPTDGTPKHYGVLLAESENYNLLSGAFSTGKKASDNGKTSSWFAAVTDRGDIRAWELASTKRTGDWSLGTASISALDQHAHQIITQTETNLTILDIEDGGDGLFTGQAKSQPVDFQYIYSYNPENFLAIGKDWAAAKHPEQDSIQLLCLKPELRRYYVPTEPGLGALMTFDPTSKYFAFSKADSVVIVALDTLKGPRIVATRSFDLWISALSFLADRNEIVVCTMEEEGASLPALTNPKIWNFNAPENTKPRSIRLSHFSGRLATHPMGTEIAIAENFVGERTIIRLFRLDSLVDERINIRPRNNLAITKMQYHPDGSSIAVGYSDGSINVFNTQNGQQLYFIGAPPVQREDSLAVRDLAFTADGQRLRILLANGQLRTFDLNPNLIRAQLEASKRPLVAFSTGQISDWNLDRALDYDQNFQKLAQSGDGPLIRAFFEFYATQAMSSNNLMQTERFCTRAHALYTSSLDTLTQRVLSTSLLNMYVDYCIKLIERGNPQRAEAEADRIAKTLGYTPLELNRIKAHAALLRHDLPTAASRYVRWSVNNKRQSVPDAYDLYFFYDGIDQAVIELSQFEAYGMLDEAQLNLLCGLFPAICADPTQHEAASARLPLSSQEALLWKVYKVVEMSDNTYSDKLEHQRIGIYTNNLADATRLRQLMPAEGQFLYEKSVSALANTYLVLGRQEMNPRYAADYFQKGIRVLEQQSNFSYRAESTRLAQLAQSYWQMAQKIAPKRPEEALQLLDKAVEYAYQLELLTEENKEDIALISNELTGPILFELGRVYLQLNDAEKAREEFNNADWVLNNGLNTRFSGHCDLLEGKYEEAMQWYRSSMGTYQVEGQSSQMPAVALNLSTILAEINQLGQQNPEKEAQLSKFASNLRREFTKTYQLDSAFVDIFYDQNMYQYYADHQQYESALLWSDRRLDAIRSIGIKSELGYYTWECEYIETQLGASYYVLFTDAVPEKLKKYEAATNALLQDRNTNTICPEYSLLLTNLGHIHLLLNQPEKAAADYHTYLEQNANNEGSDPVHVLFKDWRDLHDAGVKLPNLERIINADFWPDNRRLTPEQKTAIGL